jgi:superfamily I DNA and/or RNA helicase
MNEWLKTRSAVKSLFEKGIHFYVSEIAPGILQQNNFNQLDRSVRTWLTDLQRLKKVFVLDTYRDLQLAMKKAALCQHYDTTTFRKYEPLLTPDSKEQKKFLKLRKKFLQLHLIQSTLETEKTNWRSLPSLTETETLLNLLKNSSIIGKWKFKKQWTKVAKIPDDLAEVALHKWKQYLVNSNAISQLEIEFCEIGIDDVKNELEFIHQQIQHYTLESKNEWLQLSTADRKIYAEENQALNSLYGQIKSHFRWDDHTQIELFLSELLEDFATFLQEHDRIRTLSEPILRNLKHYTSYEGMEAAVIKCNHTKFVVQFPQFSKFETEQLLNKAHTIITEQEREFQLVAQEILSIQNERFRAYHLLLQTPSVKLNAAEKELKAVLKRGKSLLVKEFGKSRNFPSLRELFASEARIWIQLLKPIWLSNPAQIAKCFPMQDQLFDLAVFDEASQIPLQNALGAIQRSKRILVAGDHQQMGPSSYFKTQSEEITDLLHQASFYWNSISLKHHYRSEHPELIRFSNKHFYSNELIAFPSAFMESDPITFHHCRDGIFDDRKNEKEASQVAAFVETIIDSNDHLGIVAFSETQLATIYGKLSAKCKAKLEERLENDSAFFKALENVQGEECDRLIISLGYGRNPEGEFQLRFGPLNTKNGPKRLNVLLTRAKKKIDLFASVDGNDFKISSNEAVDLLRLYLLQIGTNEKRTYTQQFPYDLEPIIEDRTLKFDQIYSSIQSASELVTLVRVLEGRGWKIELQ